MALLVGLDALAWALYEGACEAKGIAPTPWSKVSSEDRAYLRSASRKVAALGGINLGKMKATVS